MRAAVLREFGPPANLRIEELAPPSPGRGEVAIAVEASGVNFPDLLVVSGQYQVLPPLPFSPGKEAAGRVLAVGPDVASLQPGDRVMAQLEYGGYSEQIVARAAHCCKLPDEVGYPEAAAMGLTFITAQLALSRRARVQPGEWVLVTGAGGGIGSAAVQLARALGARVIAIGETEEQRRLALAQGAEHVFDADPAQLRDRVLDVTDDHGADVVLESVGGDVFASCMRCIAWEGRLVVIGFASGAIPKVHAGHVLVKNVSILGLQGSDYREREPDRVRETMAGLLALVADGAVSVDIAATYPLEKAAEALAAIERGGVPGKLVLSSGGA
jgi:NADPH:quinone reductase